MVSYILDTQTTGACVVKIPVPSPQKVRKVGNSLVVTIPADFAAEHNIKPEDLLQLIVEPMAVVPKLRPELAQNADRLFAEHREALIYLKEN